MKVFFIGVMALCATGVSASARHQSDSEAVPDKWKLCSLQTGCPDVSTRLCGEIEDVVETPGGPMLVTYRCYDRE